MSFCCFVPCDKVRGDIQSMNLLTHDKTHTSGLPRGGFNPLRNSEGPPKSCQTQPDCGKLLKIAEFRRPTSQDVRKKGSKILK